MNNEATIDAPTYAKPQAAVAGQVERSVSRLVNVAVLFARDDSHYKQLPGVDVYDMARDARTYDGPWPVVAHPPCRAWATLRNHAKPRPDERNLARLAVALVREFGGVLEHPHRTTLWEAQRLPAVGQRDAFGGFTLVIDQNWWGHRAQKRTRLYVVGCEPTEVPPLPLVLGEATHTVGLWSGRDKATCRPSIAKHEYEHTPPELARWLVDLAAKCRTRQAMQAASVARLGEILDGRQCSAISAADIGAQSYADDYRPANTEAQRGAVGGPTGAQS